MTADKPQRPKAVPSAGYQRRLDSSGRACRPRVVRVSRMPGFRRLVRYPSRCFNFFICFHWLDVIFACLPRRSLAVAVVFPPTSPALVAPSVATASIVSIVPARLSPSPPPSATNVSVEPSARMVFVFVNFLNGSLRRATEVSNPHRAAAMPTPQSRSLVESAARRSDSRPTTATLSPSNSC